jgi:potassium/hydrogen antiporter
VALIVRDGSPVALEPTVRLQSGDQMLIVTPERARAATERRLRAISRAGALASWFGERGDRADR